MNKTTENMIQRFEGDDEASRADSGISGGESFDSADVVEGEGGKRKFITKKNLGRSESLKVNKVNMV